MNILIVKFGALGDVVRTSYILPGLNEKYRNSKIDWLTSDNSYDLLRFNPYIDNLMTPSFKLKIANNKKYDLVLSLDDERDVIEIVDKIEYKEIFGVFLKNNNVTYTENSASWFDMGLLSKYGKEIADKLKKNNFLTHKEIFEKMLDIKIKKPIFFNSFKIEERIKNKFDFNNKYFNIGINSGSGGRWTSKQLKIKETIKLINMLLNIKINNKATRIFLLGGPDEIERNKKILKSINNERIVNTGNFNSLLEFAAIIKYLNYIISSDSLALHLAISQNVKNLSFYAPTSANEIDTFGIGKKIIFLAKDYCSYKKDADNSTITANRIMEEFKSHIKNLK
jgi:heptosyltransferase-2